MVIYMFVMTSHMMRLTVKPNITGIATIGSIDVGSSGTIEATDKEIYTQFDITNNGSGYEFAATGIGFTEATSNPTLYFYARSITFS